jgi:hypothetical protein
MQATALPSVPTSGPRISPPRVDVYAAIHKALRLYMADTLSRLGAADPDDPAELATALDGVDALLAHLRSHLQHENDFLHSAIESRHPGGARQTADDHRDHLDSIACLADESQSLREAESATRAALAQRLYRHLAVFVGENLIHMMVEETQNNAQLWALYSDAELVALHDRLVASVPSAEMVPVMRWMTRALSVPDLAAVFSDMRRKAPPPAFQAMLEVARGDMSATRWAALARALGLPPVPCLGGA